MAPPPEIAPTPPSTGPGAPKSREISGVGGAGGAGGWLVLRAPPNHTFQDPRGAAHDGIACPLLHSQQELDWWPGEKFQAVHVGAAQQAALHVSAVVALLRPIFWHCKPAKSTGNEQVAEAAASGNAFSSSTVATIVAARGSEETEALLL